MRHASCVMRHPHSPRRLKATMRKTAARSILSCAARRMPVQLRFAAETAAARDVFRNALKTKKAVPVMHGKTRDLKRVNDILMLSLTIDQLPHLASAHHPTNRDNINPHRQEVSNGLHGIVTCILRLV